MPHWFDNLLNPAPAQQQQEQAPQNDNDTIMQVRQLNPAQLEGMAPPAGGLLNMHIVVVPQEEVGGFHGRRRTFEIRFNEFGPNEPHFIGLLRRLIEVQNFAVGEYRVGETFSAVVDYGRYAMIRNVNGNAAFPSRELIRLNFLHSFLDLLGRMISSDTVVIVSDVILTLRYDTLAPPPARGKMPKYIRDTMRNGVRGLAKTADSQGYCGTIALLLHLWTNNEALQLWRPCYELKHRLAALKSEDEFWRESVKLAKLADEFLHLGPEWDMQGNAVGAAARFVDLQPQFQILIIQEDSKRIMLFKRGREFDKDFAKPSSVVMAYSLGHLTLVKHPNFFLSRQYHYFCYVCLKNNKTVTHRCDPGVAQCDRCFMSFVSPQDQALHQEHGIYQPLCRQCGLQFHNQVCLDVHRCRSKYVRFCASCGKKYQGLDHQCGTYKCLTCTKLVETGHRCFIQREKMPAEKSAEEHGALYYVFDVESMFIVQPDGANRHVVNFVAVQKCFTGERWAFATLEEFHHFFIGLQEGSHLFAHNMQGYDGRLIFDFLYEQQQPPQNMRWRGSRIICMDYGPVKFRDTLLLLQASLAEMPNMFGLDTELVRKGFFPYKFNTPENQLYSGAIPAAEWFEPQHMAVKKRKEFELWHEKFVGLWELQTELREYCINDVDILCRSVEVYMREQVPITKLNPFDSLTIASYALRNYRTSHMPPNQICRLTVQEEEHIKPSMHGGRVDSRCLLKEYSPTEVAAGKFARYQDVNSLYPTVQFYDPMPVGAPRFHLFVDETGENFEIPADFFGFICVDIHCERYLHHPVIVHLDEMTGQLLADLNPKTKIVLASPELHVALENGYVVTRVYWLYEFEASFDLFKSYFQEFLSHKIHASGMPSWVDSAEDWEEFENHYARIGVNLDRGMMVKNQARKLGSKILINSLWGKFGERSEYYHWECFDVANDSGKLMALEQRWMDGDVDISYYRKSRDKSNLGVVFRYTNVQNTSSFANRVRRGNRNIAIASMVTSHARMRLWAELNKLGTRVIYHDTDSIIYENSPSGYNIPLGGYLGEWECETGGLPIVAFASTGPKCYSYTTRNLESGAESSVTKVKGFTLHSLNSERINYATMRSLVTGDTQQIEAECLAFQYSLRHGTMHTRDIIKLFTKTYKKGIVDPVTFCTFPFGSEKFPNALPPAAAAAAAAQEVASGNDAMSE